MFYYMAGGFFMSKYRPIQEQHLKTIFVETPGL